MIYLVDPIYNPDNLDNRTITGQTKLSKSYKIATFLGYGASSLDHIPFGEDRAQIARNLILHADIMSMVNHDKDFFKDVKMKVSEGLYEKGPTETLGGDNVFKFDGRMVGYQVYNGSGRLDLERTFDVAAFIKDYARYDRIVLDYDTYNQDKSLTATILVKVPMVPSTYDMTFDRNIETQYNGNIISKNELVEVLAN